MRVFFVLFIAVEAWSWPWVYDLREVIDELWPSLSTRGVKVKPIKTVVDNPHQKRAVCGGVGAHVATEDVCSAQDCKATAFRCPGVNGTVATPVKFFSLFLFHSFSFRLVLV
jgi:hypothetical protein